MRQTARLHLFTLACAALAPLGLVAQQPAGPASGRLEFTSSSAAAKVEFTAFILEATNLRNSVARAHALKALEADPNFGLARVYLAQAAFSPQLSIEERAAEINKGIAAASGASAPELLLALAVRENVAGRASAALPILRAAAQLVPNDAFVAFSVFQNDRAGKAPQQLVAEAGALLQRFPDYAIGYNQLAYDLHAAGDHDGEVAALRNYVRLAPTQPNAHDTWGDLMIMHDRDADAVAHAQASIQLDSGWVQGYAKIGAVRLHEGNAVEARAQFAREAAASTTPGEKLDARFWMATSYLYTHDTPAAQRELSAMITDAVTLRGTPAQRATPHQRLAVVEAMYGDKKNVALHLGHAKAIAGANPLTQAYYETLAFGLAGDAAASQAGADSYAAGPGANAAGAHTLKAWAAVTAKNWSAAEAELAQTGAADVLAKALRAELLKQQGRTADAKAIKDELLKMNLKVNNNAGVDFNKLVARLRVERLAL